MADRPATGPPAQSPPPEQTKPARPKKPSLKALTTYTMLGDGDTLYACMPGMEDWLSRMCNANIVVKTGNFAQGRNFRFFGDPKSHHIRVIFTGQDAPAGWTELTFDQVKVYDPRPVFYEISENSGFEFGIKPTSVFCVMGAGYTIPQGGKAFRDPEYQTSWRNDMMRGGLRVYRSKNMPNHLFVFKTGELLDPSQYISVPLSTCLAWNPHAAPPLAPVFGVYAENLQRVLTVNGGKINPSDMIGQMMAFRPDDLPEGGGIVWFGVDRGFSPPQAIADHPEMLQFFQCTHDDCECRKIGFFHIWHPYLSFDVVSDSVTFFSLSGALYTPRPRPIFFTDDRGAGTYTFACSSNCIPKKGRMMSGADQDALSRGCVFYRCSETCCTKAHVAPRGHKLPQEAIMVSREDVLLGKYDPDRKAKAVESVLTDALNFLKQGGVL